MALVAAVDHHLISFVPSVEVSWVLLVVLWLAIVGRERVRLLPSEDVGVHARSPLHSGVVIVWVLALGVILGLMMDSVIVLVVILLVLAANGILLGLLSLLGEHAGVVVEI